MMKSENFNKEEKIISKKILNQWEKKILKWMKIENSANDWIVAVAVYL